MAARETRTTLAWPAPVDPSRAVDDVEHDLAVLAPLLRAQDQLSVKGHAHYLLGLNEHLRRSLTERWQRWKPRVDSVRRARQGDRRRPRRARGPAAREASVLAHRAPALRRVSVPVPAAGDLSPRAVRGTDAAAAARSAHEGRAVPRHPGVRSSASGRSEGAAHHARQPCGEPRGARRAVAAVAENERESLVPAVDRVWRDEIAAIRKDLRRWVMLARRGSGRWRPERFELSLRPRRSTRTTIRTA